VVVLAVQLANLYLNVAVFNIIRADLLGDLSAGRVRPERSEEDIRIGTL
jgi:hypothetical protein